MERVEIRDIESEKGIKGSPGCEEYNWWKKESRSSADLDLHGVQGASEILRVEGDVFPGGEDTRRAVAHRLFQEGLGVFNILGELVDRGLIEESSH